jgi:23S rRNA (cytidine1920-2'-O)/16S rRNA (cytidine1409-2'-O)-methyltransferase
MRERVDVLLVGKGLFETREKARRAVMAGLVYLGEERVDKPGTKIPMDSELQVKGKVLPYVGRGGLKLEKALKVFPFTVENKIMLDIGASTGGFTDCALQNGAKLVYALDVGYNQLAWKLRQDERVVVMERTNFRYSEPADFTEGLPEIASIDVSFISLKLILPALAKILIPGGEVVVLIKPQFEAGREEVGKKGIVREASTHKKVLESLFPFFTEVGFDILNLDYSPITGGDGNIEFLAILRRSDSEIGKNHLQDSAIEDTIAMAHSVLKG